MTWNCTNATSCNYVCTGTSPSSGAVACSGSAPYTVGASGETCTINAVGAGGAMTSASASVSCIGAPRPSCTVTWGPRVTCGGTATVSWNCTNATSCDYVCGGTTEASGAVACSGTAPIGIGPGGETCAINATGPGGAGTASASTSCSPPAASCTASWGPRMACGAAPTVSWNCTNATSCNYVCTGSTPSSGAVDCTGSAALPVGVAGETCTIYATGAGAPGSASASTSCL
ncbi:MAG: hypothetical protein IPN17_08465 [Deltaproteobacteria bacterium]|nr:hypothetical protein [Deltaproteobacteria bacterium]